MFGFEGQAYFSCLANLQNCTISCGSGRIEATTLIYLPTHTFTARLYCSFSHMYTTKAGLAKDKIKLEDTQVSGTRLL